MKILIIGGISLPSDVKADFFFEKDEPILTTGFHPHPWIFNLAVGHSLNGHEVHILTLLGTNTIKKTYSDIIHNGIHFHFVRSTSKAQRLFTLYFSDFLLVKRYIKYINPDIVHAQSRGILSLFATKASFPYVVTIHGQINEHYEALYGAKKIFHFKYILDKFMEKIVTDKIQYAIAVSPNCSKNLPSNTHAFLIENPINMSFFTSSYPKKKPIQLNKIVFVGSVTERKRLDLVIKLAVEFRLTLEIINHYIDSKYYNRLTQLFQLEQRKNIKFISKLPQDELAKKVKNADILILPSDYESFGMVLAEAMALGTPVIGSNNEGIRSVITHRKTGLLFNIGDYNDLKKSFEKLRDERGLYELLSKNSIQYAQEHWSPTNISLSTIDVYKKAMKDSLIRKK